MSKPKILFYDIETTPLRAWVWRCGEQYVGHHQLDMKYSVTDIICITYCWNDGKGARSLDWDYKKQDSSQMIKDFDCLVRQADIVIGKNSNKFDNKHVNTLRLLHELPAMPDWVKYTDDLERQLRNHFNLSSYSLDYFSKILGLGGKIKMEFQDWIDIVTKSKSGLAKFNKMIKYGKKDVLDTRAIWDYVEAHIQPKYNAAVKLDDRKHLACCTCGSSNLIKNGKRQAGKVVYQRFQCNDHNGYAGRAPIHIDKKGNETLGSIGS